MFPAIFARTYEPFWYLKTTKLLKDKVIKWRQAQIGNLALRGAGSAARGRSISLISYSRGSFFVSRDGQPIDSLRESFTFWASETNDSVSKTKKFNDDTPKSAILHSGGPDPPPIPGQPG